MNARTRLRSLPWLLLTLGGALCCTRLDNGSDTFGVKSEGGATAGAMATGGGGAGAIASVGGSAAGAVGVMAITNAGASGAADVAQGGAACDDPEGFDGLGCYRCAPVGVVELENACSESTCVGFDNPMRLPLMKAGKLPDLPATGASGGSGGAGGSAGGGATGGTAGNGGAGGGGAGGGGSGNLACDALADDGTVVYVTGSTAAKPFLQQIAQQLVGQKVFVVYTAVGSCTGVDAIVNGTLMRTGPAPLPASATYWDSSASTGKPCDLPEQGVPADLGMSDVFAPSCPGFELANLESIRDAHGPIQTMTFAVPSNSQYSEISQQAAYLLFGFGKDAQVLDPAGKAPIWTDETALLKRSATSGTQVMLAAAIGVPPAQWKGKSNASSDDVAGALQGATATQAAADATIGILGADYIDSRNLRAQIRVLAFQDSHQTCAVTPDSSDTAKDKRNVRDGHYPIWGPLHLLYKVDDKGDPENAAIRQQLVDIVGYLSGSKALPNGVSLIDVYAQSGLIPECAMLVSRAQDGGDIVPHQPDSPCSCLFEKKATGKTSCAACKVQGDCHAGQSCSQGYCEGA